MSDYDEEERLDLQAELDEGFAEIEEKSVSPSVEIWI